ncbi:MAG: hydroxymethylbilane synthase [Candidatus Nitrosotenuis sp.]|nr:MAG: hydroxymethylbilane synthase [Candidatus Nitrosotenuis sp.]
MKKYVLGTRGSQLSISQTNWVVSELKKNNPNCDYEVRTILTKGDTDARPLFTIDQKGIFEKEIDKAVANHEVDFAVHSLKDVPSILMDNLILGCVPKREQVNDIFISKNNHTLETIPANSIIGTSSLRRAVQVKRKRSDLDVRPIRGNVESRIKKVQDGKFDGIVLAQAGINRIGIDVNHSKLSTVDFPPSPGQGALGIICRTDDKETLAMLKTIEDPDSRTAVESERALSTFVESGCRFPVGAHAQVNGSGMSLVVVAYSIDGTKSIIVQQTGSRTDPCGLGKSVAEELIQKGVNELAVDWREKLEEWNK